MACLSKDAHSFSGAHSICCSPESVRQTFRHHNEYRICGCHIWVEFVAGSLLCSEKLFSGYSVFPLSSKTITPKFQQQLGKCPHSSSGTFFFCLSTTLASIRFALTSIFCAYTGTSQKTLARSFLYSGFGVSGEQQDGPLSFKPISQQAEKQNFTACVVPGLVLALRQCATSSHNMNSFPAHTTLDVCVVACLCKSQWGVAVGIARKLQSLCAWAQISSGVAN